MNPKKPQPKRTKKVTATAVSLPALRGNPGAHLWTLPRDAASYAAIREQAGKQIERWLNGYALCKKYPTVVDAALAAIGITPPARKRNGGMKL
jgi:hypothetical protein